MMPLFLPIAEEREPSSSASDEPLRNGDNLTRDEFERRCDGLPDGVKAELIDGVVYMPPPVSAGGHGRPHFNLVTVFGNYVAETPGVIGYDNTSLRLDLGNMPQPDVCLTIDPALGGRSLIDADDYVVGGPEFVAEVSASTASYDLHQKLDAYRRSGVGEYVVWRTLNRQFDHFVLGSGRLERVKPSGPILRSLLLPGLWIDTAALIAIDFPAAVAEVRRGLASPEHAAFAADLARRRAAAGG